MRVWSLFRIHVWLAASILLGAPWTHAVLFKSTGDPAYNSTAPAGALASSGWQYEGNWIDFLATPIAPTFFVAAKHIGGNVGDVFVLNGFTYHTMAVTDCTNCDLRVWRVAETFPTYAPLYTASNESGKHCIVFGRGVQRGIPVIVNGVTNGWQWGAQDGVKRWGENDVASVVNGGPTLGDVLEVTFDRGGSSNECDLARNDSSGAIFIQDSGTWKLAGIHYAVDGPFSNAVDGTSFNAALLDRGGLFENTGNGVWTFVSDTAQDKPGAFYSTRISAHVSWIASVTNAAPIAPSASFTATPTSGPRPLTVTFTDTSTGMLTNRSWNFGDGVTLKTISNILTHTYSTAGTNNVTLTVTGPAGVSSTTKTNLIVVINPPQLFVSPPSLNFGLATTGQTNTLSFTATNTGDLALTGSVTTTGPFAIAAGGQLDLAPGQMQSVAVDFRPSSVGAFASTVIFRSNGGDSTNAVSGTGVSGYPPGDVNGDSHVTSSDSLLINQVLVGMRSSNSPVFQLTGFLNGDVNQDGEVTSGDSLLINQQAVGLRSFIVTEIVPEVRSNNVPTPVVIFGIGFQTNAISAVTIGPPVNLTLSNVVVIGPEQINAVVPAGGGLGTGVVSVTATPTNAVISFGHFINR